MRNPHAQPPSDMDFFSHTLNPTTDLRKRSSSYLALESSYPHAAKEISEPWNHSVSLPAHLMPLTPTARGSSNELLDYPSTYSMPTTLGHPDLNRDPGSEVEAKVDESFPGRVFKPLVKRPRTLSSVPPPFTIQDLLASSLPKVVRGEAGSRGVPESPEKRQLLGQKLDAGDTSLVEIFRKLNESHKKTPSSPSTQTSSTLTVELLSSVLGLSSQPVPPLKWNEIESRKLESFNACSPRSPLCHQPSVTLNQNAFDLRNSSPESSAHVENVSRLARTNSALSSTDNSPSGSTVDLTLSLMPSPSECSASFNGKGSAVSQSFPPSPPPRDSVFSSPMEYATPIPSVLASIHHLNKMMQAKAHLESSGEVKPEVFPEACGFPRIIENIGSLNGDKSSASAPFAAVISQPSINKPSIEYLSARFESGFGSRPSSSPAMPISPSVFNPSLCTPPFSSGANKPNPSPASLGVQDPNSKIYSFEKSSLPSAVVLTNDFKFAASKPLTHGQPQSVFLSKPELWMPLKSSGTPAQVAAAAEIWLKQHIAGLKPESPVESHSQSSPSHAPLDLSLHL